MPLPFLPGNSRNPQLGKERFHKSQHFDIPNGIPMLVGFDKPGIGGEPLFGQKIQPTHSIFPRGQDRGWAPWLVFDKQVLSFEAYSQEVVPERSDETIRVRKFKIYFYLEDDTIQVDEPKYKNSGIPQGTYLDRQRVPLPKPNQDQFYNIFHFNINQQMELFSHKFTLTDCDPFTRRFLTKLGVILNQPIPMPDDPYTTLRLEGEKSMNPLRPYEPHDTLKQFLDHDGDLLRFFCFWDDTENMFGDERDLILLYFLADDTMEVREVVPPNSGRDMVPVFLHRCKLPKKSKSSLKLHGQNVDRTVLNVFDSMRLGQRHILDRLNTGAVNEEYYKDTDLFIGAEVNVFGRRVLIADCDKFTQNYYRSKYGIEDFTPIQYKAPRPQKPPRKMPPYNGFGSEEDSLSSCRGLMLKRPQKDFRKVLEKDGADLDTNVLNFHAKMVTDDPINNGRNFIISFFLYNDSISIHEPQQENSGIIGGTFWKRTRVKKPGQVLFKSEPSEYFQARDFYVGATLCLNSNNFKLLDADEYTFNYMEQNANQFPRANVGTILSKIRSLPAEKHNEMKTFLALSDPRSSGLISYDSLRGLLLGLDCDLSEHEVLILARRFCEYAEPEADLDMMLAVAQEILRKNLFEEFQELNRAMVHCDQYKTGRLSPQKITTICKGARLPLPEDLLGGLLRKFTEGDETDFQAFVDSLNWLENPTLPVMPDDLLKSEVGGASMKKVDYAALLGDALPPNMADPTEASSAHIAEGGDPILTHTHTPTP